MNAPAPTELLNEIGEIISHQLHADFSQDACGCAKCDGERDECRGIAQKIVDLVTRQAASVGAETGDAIAWREAVLNVRNWLDVQFNVNIKSDELAKQIGILNDVLLASPSHSEGVSQPEVQIAALVAKWRAEAKRHADAAAEPDMDAQEYTLHDEADGVYRKCADELSTALSAGVAQEGPERGALTRIAAECHRAKWEFDMNDEDPPKAAAVRVLVDKAFATLHRIGDLALKLRDGSAPSSAHCTCGADDSDPLDHHDISCPVAISSTHQNTPEAKA